VLTLTTVAQTRKRNFRQRELGFFAGGSYYIGDINPRGHFLFSQPAGGVFFRYTTNYRYAFRLGLNYGKITADDAKSAEPNQKERNLNFTSNIFELNSIAEFNFLDYRIGNNKHRFTMFVFGGLALFYFDPKSSKGGGLEPLRNYKTEGEASSYSRVQMSIPFGVGFKLNIGRRCGLGIEWGPRRTFTDYLDDVSGKYPDTWTEGSKGFVDRTTNGSASPGGMRGNPSTRDWYFYYGITLNIKLPDASRPCHSRFL
jgi:hypothetical protein